MTTKHHHKQVYFARCIGPTGKPIGAYKIGCSYNRDVRITAVTTALPFTLELATAVPGGIFMEAACHLHLRDHRIAGEYFHANETVERFVAAAAERGDAFCRIFDLGYDGENDATVEAFQRYHGVSLNEACLFLGADPKRFNDASKKQWNRNRRLAAATALIAERLGDYVHWPENAIDGLLGERCARLERPLREEDAA